MTSTTNDAALSQFLDRCRSFTSDVETIGAIARDTIKYLNGNRYIRQNLQVGQQLEVKWYQSLTTGKPAWDVYLTDYYLAELWACWPVYSRKYLSIIQKRNSLIDRSIVDDLRGTKRVLDLGCGLGYTSSSLAGIFPQAEVYATEMQGSNQWRFAKMMSEIYGFTVIESAKNLDSGIDLVFASEYFEHHPQPIDHLREVLRCANPSAMLIANAFGTKAIGHFDFYQVNGESIDGKQTSKLFNAELRRHGFQKIKTKLWNSRPAYWKRQQQSHSTAVLSH
jgi:SAM-dependent methyltransferase